MKDERRPRRHRRPSPARLMARKLLLLGGLALLAWPLYELYIRIDAMAGPLKMFFDMAVGERIPVSRVIGYIDWSIFRAPLYLLCCIALGGCAVGLRKKRRACVWLLIADVALGVYGYLREGFFVLRTVRALEAVPFAVLALGCLMHLALNLARRDVRLPAVKKRRRPA